LKGSEELFAPHRTRNAPQPGFHRTPAFLSLWKVNNTLYIATNGTWRGRHSYDLLEMFASSF
jgi:hypothetical protein